MEPVVFDPFKMGQSIADVGFVIMAAAGYLVYSAIIIFVFVKWFVHIINGIIENQQQSLNEMLSLLRDLHAAFEALKNKL